MTSWTGSVRGGFWGFEKSQGVEFLPPKKKVDFRSSPRPCGECRTWRVCGGGGRRKSQHRKIVYLSPHVEKPFNSKVIKSFVPELRSRKFFLCFGIPVIYIWVMNILCIFHIFMYRYVTKILNSVYHGGQRLVSGAFRTFPVESLYAEADEISKAINWLSQIMLN